MCNWLSNAGDATKPARRLSAFEVQTICYENDIVDDEQLCALAEAQKLAGKTDLAQWVAAHSNPKARNYMTSTTLKMKRSTVMVERRKSSRLEILNAFLSKPCSVDKETGRECSGRWLPAALELLQMQGLGLAQWQTTVVNCLQFGRSKGNNIMIWGEKDRGKSFLLHPLSVVYDTFSAPAS